MTRPTRWCPLVSAGLLSVAAGLAIFFHGDDIRWLVGVQLALLAWLASVLVRNYEAGVQLPLTPISLTLTGFWLWLAVSLVWSRVPATSVLNFWWVGTFVLVYWAYTWSPLRTQAWHFASRALLAGAMVLCVWAGQQLFIQGQPPRASFINIHSFGALLMLIALPTAGYLLCALAARRRHAAVVSTAALAVLFFTIALTRGRGTSLALWLATAALLVLHIRRIPLRYLGLVAGLLVVCYGAANALLFGELGQRMASLADPADAASPRLLIWQGAWEMVRDHPWWGIGLGTYYLAWPPYRDPADATLGYYVHNDYLQIWIETGLPGLLLLVGVLLGALMMVRHYLRQPQLNQAERTEVVALSCGLGAVAAHSLLDFNLYTLSISVLVGLVLGRLHELLAGATAQRTVTVRPDRYLRPSLYRFAVVALIAVPVTYLAALGVSDHYFARGLAYAIQGDLQQAERTIRTAQRLAPASNKSLAYADLLRRALLTVPKDAIEDRRALYDEALVWLDDSLRANPYQALSHVVRGRLYEDQPDLAGATWQTLAAQEYRQALVLDPRFYTARTYWAELALRTGDAAQARAVLEPGLAHWYASTPAVIAYYRLAARLRREAGDPAGAKILDDRVTEMQAALAAFRARGPRDTARLQSVAQ